MKGNSGVFITVCIPTLNVGGKKIRRAIESVERQDYPNKQVIVMDGCSTDDTVENLKSINSDILIWKSEKDRSGMEALIKCFRLAREGLVCILGGDDYYLDGAFTAVAEKYEETNADVLYGDVIVEAVDGREEYKDFSQTRLDRIYYKSVFMTIGAFVKREHALNTYLNTQYYKYANDVLLWTTLYADNKAFEYVNSPNGIAFFSYGGLSTNKSVAGSYIETESINLKIINSRKDLKDKYEKKIKQFCSKNIVRLAYSKELDPKQYKELVLHTNDTREPIFVWGCGLDGKDCIEWLSSLGLQCRMIVDKNKAGESFSEIQIEKPERLLSEKEGLLIIAAHDYEDEIQKSITDMSLSSGIRVVSYYDLFIDQRNEIERSSLTK